MAHSLQFRPVNNKDLPSFYPWQIVNGTGQMVRCYTREATAQAALEAMETGESLARHDLYRRIDEQSRHRRTLAKPGV